MLIRSQDPGSKFKNDWRERFKLISCWMSDRDLTSLKSCGMDRRKQFIRYRGVWWCISSAKRHCRVLLSGIQGKALHGFLLMIHDKYIRVRGMARMDDVGSYGSGLFN